MLDLSALMVKKIGDGRIEKIKEDTNVLGGGCSGLSLSLVSAIFHVLWRISL